MAGYIGPGGPTVTENNGRVFITLKPSAQRDVTADQVIARLVEGAASRSRACRLYMQAAQDITIGAVVSKTQYQFTMTDIDLEELNHYGPEAARTRCRSCPS